MRQKVESVTSRRIGVDLPSRGGLAALLGAFLLASVSPAVSSAQVIDQLPFDLASDVGLWTPISPAFSDNSHDQDLGVMVLENFASSSSASAQFQYCINDVAEGEAFDVALAARIPVQIPTGWVSLVMIPTTELECFGSGLDPLGSNGPLSTQSNTVWSLLRISGSPVPAGAKAVFVRIFLNKSTVGDNMKAFIDDVLVERTDIFVDGFESGSTAGWL